MWCECEIHRDLGINFHWISIQYVGPVFPLFHRVHCCGRKQRVSGNKVLALDVSILADSYTNDH